jgi:hypothetical protein
MWKDSAQQAFADFDELCVGSENIDVAKFVDALGHANCCNSDNWREGSGRCCHFAHLPCLSHEDSP